MHFFFCQKLESAWGLVWAPHQADASYQTYNSSKAQMIEIYMQVSGEKAAGFAQSNQGDTSPPAPAWC